MTVEDEIPKNCKDVELQMGKSYWVQCNGYRTVAVYLGDGKWRSLIGGKEMFDVLHAQ